MSYKFKTIDEIFNFSAKSKRKAGDGLPSGLYPFFTSSNVLLKYLDEYDYNGNALILGTGGSASIHNCLEKFSCTADCMVLEPISDDIFTKYVYYYLSGNIQILEEGFRGAGLKHISKEYVKQIKIPVPPLEVQKQIAEILDKADELRQKKNQANEKLDEFLKSTFLDVLGDPISNPNNFKMTEIKDFATVKIGPFGSLLHAEDYIENGIPLINPSHIVNNKVQPNAGLSISNSKFKELASYSMKMNDIVVGRRGEMGRCAIIPDGNYLCGTGSLFIRIQNEYLPIVLQKVISSDSMKDKLIHNSVGVTMNNLNASTIAELEVPLYPMELQNKFVQIVEKVEEQKAKNEIAIQKLDDLFNSLMQRAFKGELEV